MPTVNNLCDSCVNIGCEFQSGIARTRCDFYMPRPKKTEDDHIGIWISVDERLPKKGEIVIASTEYFVYYDARYANACGWEWAYNPEGDFWQPLTGVTAWMPKLKPHEEVQNDGKPDA